MTNISLPWTSIETRIYFADNAGGFDLRHCPDAKQKAAFVAVAVNNHALLVAALEALVYPEDPDDMDAITLATGKAQALLAKVGRA